MNIQKILKTIANYKSQYELSAPGVQLLAVSKAHTVPEILDAIAEDQHRFGESYVDEALAKIESLSGQNCEWHFIGPIQSNKTRAIAENFAWVHSVDRHKIAERLHEQRPSHLPALNICIQVNTSGENTKSGVLASEVADLAKLISTLPRLALRGLMTITKASQNFDEQRQAFRECRLVFEDLQQAGYDVDTLSMGMSNDYEAAIAEGATIVRIGTQIFGPREV